MNWSRLAAIRTFVLVLVGLLLIPLGLFNSPWPWSGWIAVGLGLLLLAYLTDPAGVQR